MVDQVIHIEYGHHVLLREVVEVWGEEADELRWLLNARARGGPHLPSHPLQILVWRNDADERCAKGE